MKRHLQNIFKDNENEYRLPVAVFDFFTHNRITDPQRFIDDNRILFSLNCSDSTRIHYVDHYSYKLRVILFAYPLEYSNVFGYYSQKYKVDELCERINVELERDIPSTTMEVLNEDIIMNTERNIELLIDIDNDINTLRNDLACTMNQEYIKKHAKNRVITMLYPKHSPS